MRYKVTTWHGEGDSLYYIVDTEAPEGEQPAVVACYSGRAYGAQAYSAAQLCRDVHNQKGRCLESSLTLGAHYGANAEFQFETKP